jgi:hypothetical protein
MRTDSSVERIALLARAKHLEEWQRVWRQHLAAEIVSELVKAFSKS